MKAPEPNFTSSTRASVPSAIFLLMIDDAMSGIASTVPVMSRSAYSFPSAGARPEPAAQMTAPTSLELREHLLVGRAPRASRDRLELVERAAGVTEAAAGELRHRDAERGDEGRERQRDLVADPAGRVLVDGVLAQARRSQALTRRDHRESGRGSRRAPCRSGRSPSSWRTSARRRRSRACRRRSARRSGGSRSAAVALGADQVDGVEASTAAMRHARRASSRSRGPNASGITSSIVLMPETVSSSIPGPSARTAAGGTGRTA